MMMKCPRCGSTEYSIIASDMNTQDKTDFSCLDCGLYFFVFENKIYTEENMTKLTQENKNESNN